MLKKGVAFIALIVIGIGQFLPSFASAEELVVIVNKTNPISNISRRDLGKIFKAEKQFWKGAERIVLFTREAGSPEMETSLKLIYNMSEGKLKRFWFEKIFTGEVSNPPKDLPSSSLMKKVVASMPNAIGYVFKNEVDDTVKVLKIDGTEVLE